MSRRFPAYFLLVVALGCALLLAACGSSSKPETAATLIAQTFATKQTIESGQVSTAVDANLHGLSHVSGPISFQLSGPFQDKAAGELPDFDISMLLGAGGHSFETGILATQGKAYMQFGGTSYVLTPKLYASFKKSYLAPPPAKKNAGTLGAFGIHPGLWLTNPVILGTATVGGVKTEHLGASIEVGRFLADLSSLLGDAGKLGVKKVKGAPTSISAREQAAIARSVTASKVDIFTGASDHTLRSLTISIALVVAPADRSLLGGITGGTFSIDVSMSGVNQHQTIAPPAHPQPLSAALPSGSGSSGSTGATTGPSGPAVSAPAPYLTCLKKAGGSVAAIQKCAALLDG